MREQTLQTVYGCLLHDFGKIVYRAGGRSGTHSHLGWEELYSLLPCREWQPALDCLRWHHGAELHRALPSADHPAYIAYAADNLSAAADRREIEGEGGCFIRNLPLQPIFSHMNGEHSGFSVPAVQQDGTLRMPQKAAEIPASRYADAEREIKMGLRETMPEADRINSLLVLLESWTSMFPSSTFSGESPDISLFDHLKTTAAIGCCISEYLQESGERDLRGCLFEREAEFRNTQAFLFYSADLSGIQRFIYTVSEDKALRSLKSRSFFLGLLMEHYADEILDGCGLCRANLLYSGGGHCYLLLPNTARVQELLKTWNAAFNQFLMDEFGINLFVAHGWTACCGNDLINHPAAEAPYKKMFRKVSSAVSAHKLHRYSPDQLRRLNSKESSGERECKVCGRTDRLQDELCSWCRCFIQLAEQIQKKDVYLVTASKLVQPDFSLPSLNGMVQFVFTDEQHARTALSQDPDIRRIYTKNKSCIGLRYSTRLYVCDYEKEKRMDKLADQSEGIRRIAVCRMDVDNLGQAFVAGFETKNADPVKRYHYVTISRTSAFSRQISLFFQLYMNSILSGEFENRAPLAVRIVYSGGDDVFLVGAWDDVIEAANRIQQDFDQFTCRALTISGGIGLFGEHYPIRAEAYQTASLEERAKREPEKNSVSLFDANADHTYGWRVFRENVLNEKVTELQTFFDAFPELGNACLYRLLQLLRAENGKIASINLARYAYQLARMEPSRTNPNWKVYRKFADSMYLWGLNTEDRKQLITAIYLYVYENRGV